MDFGGLFNDCSTQCEAYTACGGGRLSAPCGCVWKDKSKRYKCSECYIVCRDYKEVLGNGQTISFIDHIAQGLMLEQLVVKQSVTGFPTYIPLNTQFFRSKQPYPIRWVGADLQALINPRKKKEATLKRKFSNPESSRKFLNVDMDCGLISVLNGKDSSLESLWGMGEEGRSQVFETLNEVEFSSSTGATFSLTNKTTEGGLTPYSHNSYMLMRHNKVVSEIQNSGMDAIPNIYWLDNDQREIQKWGEWLKRNPEIKTVSRDFTLTKNSKTVLSKVAELNQLLRVAGRKFHVLIIGTGPANAPRVVRELAAEGHTVSIVTGAPIYDARIAAQKYVFENGRINKVDDKDTPYYELAVHNMKVFENALLHVLKDVNRESTFRSNFKY